MMPGSLIKLRENRINVNDVLNKSLRPCFVNIFYGDFEERTGKKSTVIKMHKNFKKVLGKAFLEGKINRTAIHWSLILLAWLSQEGINFKCEQESV